MKRLLMILISLLLIITVNSFGIEAIAEPTTQENLQKGTVVNKIPDGYNLVAESSNIAFYFRNTDGGILLKDKRNGYIWGFPQNLKDSDVNGNKYILKNTQSAFNITYADPAARTLDIMPASVATEKVVITSQPIDNGVKVTYDMVDQKFKITIEYKLEGDDFIVNIPARDIKEYGNLRLVTLELLPYFGAATDRDKGYAFYPDGSGAISYFKSTHPVYFKNYQGDIYGADDINLNENKYNKAEVAMLPVFGLKNGDNAFMGIVTKGEYDATINYSPSGYQVNLNRVSVEFTYRRSYQGALQNGSLTQKLEPHMLKIDRSVTYKFLTGPYANYSGMANAYRQYLIDHHELRQVIKKGDNMPLGLDLFMGIEEHQLLRNKFIPMTTFDQADTILKDIRERGVSDVQVNLVGWNARGYLSYPLHFPVNGALGGTEGLKRLISDVYKMGIKISLQDNYVDIYADYRGFSRKNIAYQANKFLPVTNIWNNRFLESAGYVYDYFNYSIFPDLLRLKVNGITFERFGNFLFYDFNDRYPSTRTQTASYWMKMVNKVREKLGFAAIKGGNAYVLKYADRLYDIPEKDSGYFFSDEAVPFYQMVVHGSIPYSGTPINMFYDPKAQLLKLVEYGYMPYYQLTYRSSNEMMYTDYNELFSSQYTDWVAHAEKYYKKMNEDLKPLWSEYMVDHKKVNDYLYVTTYSNGAKVYVNYSENDVEVDGRTIKGYDYLVVGGGM
ncbi:hypothetical protein SAMN02746089_00831 [Caldanaerobius fijiensis DSM 17918]|uniref:Uncharacterized protein n=1 Tax=Caldanaerobius fijiensis DSM 17918 TaxID=1121256 RepID=A0A1M4WK13_9THEO|nr:DUF5696 domain-containing protein [Caldanaerobius fijiensis]SHE81534.1 hypothetical protein SAMN02746089_00831 [Caldanaerobius fijiensis DSM 17918]